MDLGGDEGGGTREQGAEEREKCNQEELKCRKAVRVRVKVGQKERVLHQRYGIRRDHNQFGVIQQGRTLCVFVELRPCPSLGPTIWLVRWFLQTSRGCLFQGVGARMLLLSDWVVVVGSARRRSDGEKVRRAGVGGYRLN